MLLTIMAVSRSKKPARKPSTKPAAKPQGRKKSKLTLAGEEAAREAKRSLLLRTLKECEWNLTRTAEALDMTAGSDVVRALKELAPEVYEAAKARGDIAPGRPTDN